MAEGQGTFPRISFRYAAIGRFLDVFLISFIFSFGHQMEGREVQITAYGKAHLGKLK